MDQSEVSREAELLHTNLYKEIYFKELSHGIVGTGKSKIHQAAGSCQKSFLSESFLTVNKNELGTNGKYLLFLRQLHFNR